MEERSDTEQQYGYRDAIGDFAEFDKLETGVFENAFGNTGGNIPGGGSAGKPVAHPAAYEDTTEQRQQDAQDLRGGKSFYRTQTKIEQNNGRHQYGQRGRPGPVAGIGR